MSIGRPTGLMAVEAHSFREHVAGHFLHFVPAVKTGDDLKGEPDGCGGTLAGYDVAVRNDRFIRPFGRLQFISQTGVTSGSFALEQSVSLQYQR